MAPDQAKTLLNGHPQLAYALFQAMLMMNVVDPNILQRILTSSGALTGEVPQQAQAHQPPPPPGPVGYQQGPPPPQGPGGFPGMHPPMGYAGPPPPMGGPPMSEAPPVANLPDEQRVCLFLLLQT